MPTLNHGQAGLHPRPQEVDVFLAMDEHGAGVHGRVAGRPLAWTSGSVSPVSTPVGGARERDNPPGKAMVWFLMRLFIMDVLYTRAE